MPKRLSTSRSPIRGPAAARIFDWDAARARLEELNARAEDPTLWNDAAAAQALMRERNRLADQIDGVRGAWSATSPTRWS